MSSVARIPYVTPACGMDVPLLPVVRVGGCVGGKPTHAVQVISPAGSKRKCGRSKLFADHSKRQLKRAALIRLALYWLKVLYAHAAVGAHAEQ